MILNFMEDDVAVESVQYLYKTEEGYTRSIPFFSIPSLKEKLTAMGPGEAFIDTDLTKLGGEIALLQLAEKVQNREIDIELILDMPSLKQFKDRLDEVLDS